MKLLNFCFSCVAVAFAGCSDNQQYIPPTGYYVKTEGCVESTVDVIRIAKEGDVYKARVQHYTCNNSNKLFSLDYGEFKGAAPVGFTPQPIPKEGVVLLDFVPPKSLSSHFSIFDLKESNFVFVSNGNSIRKFPSESDRKELAFIKTDEGKRLPREIQQAVLAENSTEGVIKYVKFAEENDPIQVERHDLHHWFSNKDTGP